MLADINEEALRAATDELTAAGHNALSLTCVVSDEDQVAALVERTVDTFGRLDMAFNNAGIQVPPSDAADEPAANFDRVNAINLRQAILPPRGGLAAGCPRRGGHISSRGAKRETWHANSNPGAGRSTSRAG